MGGLKKMMMDSPGGKVAFWKENAMSSGDGMGKAPPGFTKFRTPEGEGPQRLGNRPKNRKYPSKARTPLGG